MAALIEVMTDAFPALLRYFTIEELHVLYREFPDTQHAIQREFKRLFPNFSFEYVLDHTIPKLLPCYPGIYIDNTKLEHALITYHWVQSALTSEAYRSIGHTTIRIFSTYHQCPILHVTRPYMCGYRRCNGNSFVIVLLYNLNVYSQKNTIVLCDLRRPSCFRIWFVHVSSICARLLIAAEYIHSTTDNSAILIGDRLLTFQGAETHLQLPIHAELEWQHHTLYVNNQPFLSIK